MNGQADNPMAHQFISAYPKLQFKCELLISAGSNISPQESQFTSNVLTVGSFDRKRLKNKDEVNIFNEQNFLGQFDDLSMEENGLIEWNETLELQHCIQNEYLTDSRDDPGVAFIANIIERRLTTRSDVHCNDCLHALKSDERLGVESCISTHNGRPSSSCYKLCKLTDSVLKIFINTGPQFKQKVYLDVMRNVNWHWIFPQYSENDHDAEHKSFIVKFIIDEYINRKCAYVAKQKMLDLRKKYLRNKLRKLCHNVHQ